MRTSHGSIVWRLLLVLALLAPGLAGAAGQPFVAPSHQDASREQAGRQQTQPYNNAPIWRDVRSERTHQTQVRGVETGVLIQSGGETWRELRNGPVSLFGGLLLVAFFTIILLFHLMHGAVKVKSPLTGRMLPRFSDWERWVHWSVAITFCILAISGLILLFGKHVLLPIIGHTLFSWLAIFGKNLHNFVGPLFVFSAIVMFVTYVKDNLWKSYDFRWFKNLGGMLGGEHIASGKYNAGEKVWFWLGLFVLTLIVGVTGFILDFPNFEQGRGLMQQAHIIHAIAAILYMTMSLGHIYMGTIGVEGAYDSMRNGQVDESWAKEHHEHWYHEVKAGKTGQKTAGVAGGQVPQPR